jgi:hypothetical protein
MTETQGRKQRRRRDREVVAGGKYSPLGSSR